MTPFSCQERPAPHRLPCQLRSAGPLSLAHPAPDAHAAPTDPHVFPRVVRARFLLLCCFDLCGHLRREGKRGIRLRENCHVTLIHKRRREVGWRLLVVWWWWWMRCCGRHRRWKGGCAPQHWVRRCRVAGKQVDRGSCWEGETSDVRDVAGYAGHGDDLQPVRHVTRGRRDG